MNAKVSKYMSYLLRHAPEGLEIDEEGFAALEDLLRKLRRRYDVDEQYIRNLVNQGERKRFEIVGTRIRALYGHSLPVKIRLKEDRSITLLYHGTTRKAASQILETGLKPMKRKWVHLSPTKEIAVEVGQRRTSTPIILEVNAKKARKGGLKFFKATERVIICREIPPQYIKRG